MAPFIKEVVEGVDSGLVGVCMEGRLAGGAFLSPRSSLGSDARESRVLQIRKYSEYKGLAQDLA